MPDPAAQEIHDLHAFLAAWYRGEIEKTRAAFARAYDVTAEAFTFVSPASGQVIPRDVLLGALYERHGTLPGYDAQISAITPRHRVGEIAIYTYVIREVFDAEREQTVTVSITFRDAPAAPNGVAHLHVHETLRVE